MCTPPGQLRSSGCTNETSITFECKSGHETRVCKVCFGGIVSKVFQIMKLTSFRGRKQHIPDQTLYERFGVSFTQSGNLSKHLRGVVVCPHDGCGSTMRPINGPKHLDELKKELGKMPKPTMAHTLSLETAKSWKSKPVMTTTIHSHVVSASPEVERRRKAKIEAEKEQILQAQHALERLAAERLEAERLERLEAERLEPQRSEQPKRLEPQRSEQPKRLEPQRSEQPKRLEPKQLEPTTTTTPATSLNVPLFSQTTVVQSRLISVMEREHKVAEREAALIGLWNQIERALSTQQAELRSFITIASESTCLQHMIKMLTSMNVLADLEVNVETSLPEIIMAQWRATAMCARSVADMYTHLKRIEDMRVVSSNHAQKQNVEEKIMALRTLGAQLDKP